MQTMTHSIEMPSWMIPVSGPTEEVQGKSIAAIRKDLRDKQFEIFFETILQKLSMGIALTEILRDDQRDFDYAELLRWIHRDSSRKSRYQEAQKIGTEMIMAECIEIADGKDGMEDVQRSKLRIDTRLFQVKSWNRDRYGNHTTIETHQSININAVLEMANARVPQLGPRVIDHEDIE